MFAPPKEVGQPSPEPAAATETKRLYPGVVSPWEPTTVTWKTPPVRTSSRKALFIAIGGTIAALLVVCVCSALWAAVSGGGGSATKTAQARSTGTAVQVAALAEQSSAQTATVRAIPTATAIAPTATLIPPTPTPTPTPTSAPTEPPVAVVSPSPEPTFTRPPFLVVPTATAPGATAAESEYLAWAIESSGAMKRSFDRANALFNNPRLFDNAWKVDVAVELAIWRTSYAEAKKKSPPPKFVAAHRKYLAALEQYDSATVDIAWALDNITASNASSRLNQATAKMKLGNQYIEEATALFR